MPGLGTKEGTAFRQDLLINRPVAEPSLEGFFFFATDDKLGTLYQCDGEEWVPITGGLRGLVGGSGISLVNTPTTITINNTYSLPIATSSILGGIKVGSGLAIDSGGIMTLDLPSDLAYTDHINTFSKKQFITVPDDDGLIISVIGEGLSVYSEDFSAASFISRAGVGVGTGLPCVDIFADFTCLRLVQSLDGLDYVGVSVPNPVLEVFRGSSTFSGKIFTGPLIQGNDHPVGTQVSTGPLIQLQKFSVDKFVIDNSGNIKTVSGVTPSNGQLLIGNGSGMSVAALTAGSNITITNGAGTITIASTAVGTTETIKHGGTTVGTRPSINFIDGSNVTLTVADNGGTNAVDVTIASTGGGGGGGSTIPPYVKAWSSASQTLTGTTTAKIALNSTFIDIGTGTPQHDNVTNNTRLTCRVAGTYLVGGTAVGFANAGYNPAAEYQLTLMKNGAAFTGLPFEIHPGSTYAAGSSVIVSWLIDLAVNDYIEMSVSVTGANSGDTFLIFPSGFPDNTSTLWMQYLGSGIGAGSVQHSGSLIGTRPKINFIDGSNVTLTVADNPGSDRVDVTIASTAVGTTETIKHGGTTVGTRPTINFIDGSNVTLTIADNGGTNAVDVTIASTGGGGGGSTVPSVKATNTVATTVTSGVGSGRSIPFNTTLYDQGTGTAQHSTSSNTDRLTCQTNGIYLITATVWWTNNSTGIRELSIDKIRISDSFDVTLAVDSVGASTPSAQEVSVQAELVVGDYVLALVTQTSGGNLDIIADASGEYAQSFSMTKIA